MSMKKTSHRNRSILLIMSVASLLVLSYVNAKILAASMSMVIQSYLVEVFRNGDSQSFRDASDAIRRAVCEKSLWDDICALGFYGDVWQGVSSSVERLEETLKDAQRDAAYMFEKTSGDRVDFQNSLDLLGGHIAETVRTTNEVHIISVKRGDLIDGNWFNSNVGQCFQIGFIEKMLVNGKGKNKHVYPDKGRRRFFYFKAGR